MDIEQVLEDLGQISLLKQYRNSSSSDKNKLKQQILSLDFEDMKNQRRSFFEERQTFESGNREEGINTPLKKDGFEPLMECEYYSEKYKDEGLESLNQGEVGVIILSGGMGSRLCWDHPKGMFPVSLVKKKTLFQLFSEKVLCAEKKYGKRFFLSFMTSSKTHGETVAFFRENGYFGLDKDQVDFFVQKELPFLDNDGNFVLEKTGTVATGPDGNGDVFDIFKNSPVFEKFKKNGVKYLSVIPIDNPLADPFDEVFLGFHKRKNSEVSLIVLEKKNQNEKMGVVAGSNNKIKIIEYIHLSEAEKKQYRYLNTSIFMVSMDFVLKNKFTLPFHFVKKRLKIFVDIEMERSLWKAEKFIFDVLSYCNNEKDIDPSSLENRSSGVNVICFQKNSCYGPLKSYSGRDALLDVQDALYKKDRYVFFHISGKEPEDKVFELAIDFHYPTEQTKKKWKDRSLPESSYVEI